MKLPEYLQPQDDPYYQVMGRCVAERRMAKRMTQGELALEGGLSRAEVQFIENAKRRVKFDTLRRCCAGLGICVTELTAEVERRLREP